MFTDVYHKKNQQQKKQKPVQTVIQSLNKQSTIDKSIHQTHQIHHTTQHFYRQSQHSTTPTVHYHRNDVFGTKPIKNT